MVWHNRKRREVRRWGPARQRGGSTCAADKPVGMYGPILGKDCQWHYSLGNLEDIVMPTRNVNLTAEQDAFIQEAVEAGRYQNASEAMRDAVRSLQQRLQTDDLKLDLLRTQIQAGLAALDRGAFTEVDDADLDDALDRLTPKAAG
ncbi:type II toxin-antitoxin system ParD family antitoxin [Aquibaculum sediminis]|uniref:type II toxin-antitoxin system ParD family antitoxin n=1 Tax=Aquibaculum sediminis TaxID=3231907 RepID=UPI003456ACCF